MKIEKQLEELTVLVREYYKTSTSDGQTLNELLKKITALLFYLTTVRSEVHDEFQNYIHNKTRDKGMSVARAENEAHVNYPAMYRLRHILDSANDVVGAIRTNISYLKKESDWSK
jgi:hypothetical protein